LQSAAVVADSIHYFLQGGSLKTADEVRNYVLHELAVANEHDARFAEAWDDVAPDLDYANPADELPYSLINVESSVNELVPTAVGIFLIFRHDAEAAICAAARSGGDTDTVASLVGALSGAYHGFSKLPEKWLNQIDHKDRIEKMCEQIIKLWK
jgi:ADP-ribosylglycohydrolase